MEKVVVGLSGGVDSAVCAALLKQKGFEVHGLFLDFGLSPALDAKRVAGQLDIPFHVSFLADELDRNVCQYYMEEYKRARTPNPCIVCNPTVKFRALSSLADGIGAAYIATGHYARTARDAQGRPLLLAALSPKDQSYMLARLSRETVGRALFPLGGFAGKQEVREKARELSISVAEKKDSMETCFVPDGDVAGYMARRGVTMPQGDFVDENGKVLGKHMGLNRYTVGQRRGLGIASTGRLFVQRLDPVKNQVVLSLNDVYKKEVFIQNVTYLAPEYAQGGPFCCQAKIRFSKKAQPVEVIPDGGQARLLFCEPARAPAAGQAAVLYDGDIVIGSGFIDF